jgi:succinyl-diaminopimelate desuccinylase
VEKTAGGTKLTGRGVEDNQAGSISSILAALTSYEQRKKLNVNLRLLFVSDEENGSVWGVQWLLKNHPELFKKGDMFLVPDSGDAKGETIEIAEKSMLQCKFTVRGKQAHASRPDEGINAMVAASALTVRLAEELPKAFPEENPLFEPPASTFAPTKREPNVENVNSIPGLDVFYLDMRILPSVPLDAVLEKIKGLLTEIVRTYSVKIDMDVQMRSESKAGDPNSPLSNALKQAVKDELNVTARPVGIGGGTVAAFFRNLGFDCAVWSVLHDTAHQPDEWIYVEDILNTAKVMTGAAGLL